MLNKDMLQTALDLHERCYTLLMWINTAIEKGFIHVAKLKQFSSVPHTAEDWLKEHHKNIPENCRPEHLQQEYIKKYINMLLSFFSCSMIIVKNPGKRYIPHTMRQGKSAYIKNPFIKPIKIKGTDKKRTQKLKINYIHQLIMENNLVLNEQRIDNLILNTALQTDLARAVYGQHIMMRMQGHYEGPALLVLWREFTRDENSAPIKNISLTAKSFMDNEQKILSILST